MKTLFTDEQIIKIAKASLTEEEAKHFDDCQGKRQIEQFQAFAANVIEAWLAQQEPVAWMNDDGEMISEYYRKMANGLPYDDMYPLFLAPPTASEGYVLMPVKPNPAMREVLWDVLIESPITSIDGLWESLLTAGEKK